MTLLAAHFGHLRVKGRGGRGARGQEGVERGWLDEGEAGKAAADCEGNKYQSICLPSKPTEAVKIHAHAQADGRKSAPHASHAHNSIVHTRQKGTVRK